METLTFNSASTLDRDEAIVIELPFVRLRAGHISDHDLERYYLGTIGDEKDLGVLEEHLLICPECVERADESDAYVDRIRAAIVDAGLDVL
jgi:hypothetical protein